MNGDQEEFCVLGETPDLMVVDKPAGLLVHPSKPGGPKTLWDGLRELLAYEIANGGQVSLINRLDRETSGIVLVAKNASAARSAAIAMQEGQIKKTYLTLVYGHPERDTFSIDAPIIRQGEVTDTRIHLKRTIHPAGAHALTHFTVKKRFENQYGKFSLVEAKPITGRTHQIRVHMASTGHYVVGDKIYGPSEQLYLDFIETGWTPRLVEILHLPRHALHSSGLTMPWNGENLCWQCKPPQDFQDFIEDRWRTLS